MVNWGKANEGTKLSLVQMIKRRSMTMNKAELIAAVAEKAALSKKDSEARPRIWRW